MEDVPGREAEVRLQDRHDPRGAQKEAGDEDAARCEDLRCELRDRAKREDVVREPGDEQDRGAGEDAEQLLARGRGPDREAGSEPSREAGEDPDAAEEGRRTRVPAVEPRRGDDAAAERRPDDRPDRERGDGQAHRDDGEPHACLPQSVASTGSSEPER